MERFKDPVPKTNGKKINGKKLAPEGPMARRMNILVVDDRSNVLRMMGYVLEDLGHSHLTACDGKDALDVIDRCRSDGIEIDLVISDLRMPVMDGHGLLKELKRICPELPVVISTSVAGFVDHGELLRAGAFAVMEKFSSPEKLEMTIRLATKNQ